VNNLKFQCSAVVAAAYRFRATAFKAAVSQGTEYDAANPEEPGARLVSLLSCGGPNLPEFGVDIDILLADPLRATIVTRVAHCAYLLGLGVLAAEHVARRDPTNSCLGTEFRLFADFAVRLMESNPTDISVLASAEVLAARRAFVSVLQALHTVVLQDQLRYLELAPRGGFDELEEVFNV